jgi:membrane protease YdiL (CAAX protease family)
MDKEVENKPKAFYRPLPTVLLTLLVFAVSQILASLFVVLLSSVLGWSQGQLSSWLDGATGQFILITLIEGAIILMLYWLLRIKKLSFKDVGLKKPKLNDLAYGIIGYGVYFLLYLVISVAIRLLLPSLDLSQQQKIGFDSAHGALELSLVFASLVVMPPLVEEILARGFLYTGLKTKLPRWIAVITTSLMFAAAHLQFGSGAPLLWVAFIDTFTLSLVLLYLKEKTGSLTASITLHMLKNSVAFFVLFIIGTR